LTFTLTFKWRCEWRRVRTREQLQLQVVLHLSCAGIDWALRDI